MRSLLAFLLLIGLTAGAGAAGPQPTLPLSPLTIETARGPLRFTVELADTPQTREPGLMFRRHLAPHAGMLFDFQTEQNVVFWMKNTLIPLDMLFIRADGRIARIAARTKPLSEGLIPSGGPVRAVLEIAGGRAAALGIKKGDLVRHAVFGNLARPRMPALHGASP